MGIIWLASYPKSGNTWLRAFLANYFTDAQEPVDINQLPDFCFGENHVPWFEMANGGKSVAGLDDAQIAQLRPKAQMALARHRPHDILVKTHNAVAHVFDQPMINPSVTSGAVYVIRNPLDVAVSYAHHLGISQAEMAENMAAPSYAVAGHDHMVFQYLGDWSAHVKSWVDAPGLRLHTMRYEDMLSKPGPGFTKLIKFMGLKKNVPRLTRSLKFSNFKTLKGQEQKGGFVEKSREADAFFRKGQAGGWREELEPDLVKRILDDHGEMMDRFGYLDKNGDPR
ncbi:MAG: sulfotransferase domain-containing protein [Alphaproteobacteria bacterium]